MRDAHPSRTYNLQLTTYSNRHAPLSELVTMRSWTALLLAGGLLAAHSLLPTAQAQATTCPAVSLRTRKAVLSNRKATVAVKLHNPNPWQALDGVSLSVTLPDDVLYVRSTGIGAKQGSPTQAGQVLSWSNLSLKRTLAFNIKVNVTDCAYQGVGTRIVFNAQSSLATPCTADAPPQTVTVKPSKTAATAVCGTASPTAAPSSAAIVCPDGLTDVGVGCCADFDAPGCAVDADCPAGLSCADFTCACRFATADPNACLNAGCGDGSDPTCVPPGLFTCAV